MGDLCPHFIMNYTEIVNVDNTAENTKILRCKNRHKSEILFGHLLTFHLAHSLSNTVSIWRCYTAPLCLYLEL